jgi:NADH-quinone oxidoreductase subunit B
MMQLQRKMKIENYFGTVNHKEKDEHKAEAKAIEKKIINSEEEA